MFYGTLSLCQSLICTLVLDRFHLDIRSRSVVDEYWDNDILIFIIIVLSFVCHSHFVISAQTWGVFLKPFTYFFQHCLAAASRDQPASHCQPRSLQRQGVRECDWIGQSRDRDVEQDSASSSGGICSHGQGTACLCDTGSISNVVFVAFL